MIKLESLKKKEHFLLVLKNRIINNDFFSIYCKKNFIHNKKKNKLYISFVIKKKIGNSVKRKRIKRKLRSKFKKKKKKNGAINLNFKYFNNKFDQILQIFYISNIWSKLQISSLLLRIFYWVFRNTWIFKRMSFWN